MTQETMPAAPIERLALLVERPEPVIEAELWDSARLEEHGRLLAAASGGAGGRRLDLRRHLRANATALQSAYTAIVRALQAGRAITPAAQWIVDNFHVISDQLGDVPLRLTVKGWRELPLAGHADAAGLPRIYHIATEYLRHRLFEFHPESLLRMLAGYQSVAPLQMQEIWILYPVLRIALIDELRRIAERVEDSLASRAAADELTDLLAGEAPRDAHEAASDTLLYPAHRFAPPFIVQLAHRLQGMGEHGRPLLDVLSRELSRSGITIDDYIQRQHARRSSSNLAARNIITSLRELASFDWRSLFEKSSLVEAMLLGQPDYAACDRRTRDRYRSSIEGIAKATGRHEVQITQQILTLLQKKDGTGAPPTLGSWLIGSRRLQLEDTLGTPLPAGKRLRRWSIRHARSLYFGGILVLTLAVLAATISLGTDWRASSHGLLALLALLAAFPASELVIGRLNRRWLHLFPPRHLPRRALASGLGADMQTLVVVHMLLRSADDAVVACRQLHVHALANPDAHIRFALLSDWTDSATETRPDDLVILDAARREIAALNAAEPVADGEPRFFLLHRRRVWSRTEGCFAGWERKRGKLQELNQLLLDRGDTTFIPDSDGIVHAPRNTRYVLTVDADTRLPLGSVRDLVGTAAHPLNLPVMSPEERRVVAGYGVLQPRITPLLPGSEERSLYREIITTASGIDPYAAAVSDLYQDVFGEGLFTGKGLYDLAVWDECLRERIPAESLLSHDLFEGLFVRCGLVSDMELFEDFPSHSEVAAAR